MGLHHAIQIRLARRHMSRVIKTLHMIQLCRTHLSTEYQSGFLLIYSWNEPGPRTWLDLQYSTLGVTWTTLPVVIL